MHSRDFEEFSRLLDDAYDLIGSGQNKIISGGAKALFFNAMAPFSLDVFRAALSAHCLDKVRGRFTPKPADIIEQIEGRAANDGRLSADEAWAVALTSRDEADTVVWTQEMAEAFALCLPVFPDEVGARMAFKDAYNRLVTQARTASRPVEWGVSLGWDTRKRERSLTKALDAGLLQAPMVAGLLSPPDGIAAADQAAHAQIEKIKKMMADMNAERARDYALSFERERNQTADAKARARAMTETYLDPKK